MVGLDEDPVVNLVDRLVGVVQKDTSKLGTVLERHQDLRGELEPILATAVKIESVKHPVISADARNSYKQKILASTSIGPPGPPGTGGSTPAAPPGGPQKNGGFQLGAMFQTLVNVVVIIGIVLALVIGGMLVLPVRTPLGQLAGEMANRRHLLEGLMKNEDLKSTAKALNENPQFMSDIIAAVPPAVAAEVMNRNPESNVKMMGMLDPKAVAVPINENGKLFAEIVGHLNPAMLGRVITQNPQSTNDLLKYLDPRVVANIVNLNGAFINDFISYPSPVVLADVVNDNEPFITAFMRYADPKTIALMVNKNAPFLSLLVNRLDPGVLARAINANGNFVMYAMANSDPTAMATAVNSNGDFISRLLGHLSVDVLADVLNASVGVAESMPRSSDPGVIADVLDNQGFMLRVIGAINPVAVAGALNANGAFLTGLVANMDPAQDAQGLAAALETGPDAVQETLQSFNLDVIAGAANNSGTFLQEMMSKTNPEVTAKIVSENIPFITSLIGEVDPRVVAAAINGNQSFLAAVLGQGNPEGTARVINAVINANQGWVSGLLGNLDARTLAAALNMSPDRTSKMLSVLSPGAVASILNRNEKFLTDLISFLKPEVLLKADETNATFMKGLMDNLSGAKIADAINDNLKKTGDQNFILNLVKNLPTERIAAALGSDYGQQFIRTFIGSLSENDIKALLENEDTRKAQKALITNVLPLLGSSTLQVIADAINHNAKFLLDYMGSSDPYVMTDVINSPNVSGSGGLIEKLVPNLNPTVLAKATDLHPEMVGQMLANMDTKVIGEILNKPENQDLLVKLVGKMPALTAGMRKGENHIGRYLGIRVNAVVQLSITIPPSTVFTLWANADEIGSNPLLAGSSAEAWIWLGRYSTTEKTPGW